MSANRPVRRWRTTGASVVTGLVLAAAVTAGASQATAPIALWSPLPRIEGETLAGKTLVLPDAAGGKVRLLVFSFSRAGGEAARGCTDAFGRIGLADADATSFAIMMLGDVPWLIRGMVVAGIRSGVPASRHGRTVKVVTDGAAWRKHLGVQSADAPHLVLLDRAGRVRWLQAGPCDTAGERNLREQLKNLLAEKAASE